MSIEFIPAKDLPVAEGDEVDVLCVENGELKRKEGASLGGGGTNKTFIFDVNVAGREYFANEEFCSLIYAIFDGELGFELLPRTIYYDTEAYVITRFKIETLNRTECVRLRTDSGTIATVCFTEEDASKVENTDMA